MTAQEIKGIRISLGLTQDKFAYKLGVSSSTINFWETGRVSPSPLALEKLYQAQIEASDSCY
jgi:DNA-binding transcriptional regulator YiaG